MVFNNYFEFYEILFLEVLCDVLTRHDLVDHKHLLNQSLQFIAPGKALFFNPKVCIFFLFLHKNIYCGYSIEVPR